VSLSLVRDTTISPRRARRLKLDTQLSFVHSIQNIYSEAQH
jgi:hypothetical protein